MSLWRRQRVVIRVQIWHCYCLALDIIVSFCVSLTKWTKPTPRLLISWDKCLNLLHSVMCDWYAAVSWSKHLFLRVLVNPALSVSMFSWFVFLWFTSSCFLGKNHAPSVDIFPSGLKLIMLVSLTGHPSHGLPYLSIRAVPDLFFPIRPEPDFAGFGMTNPAGAGFSNWL